MKVFEQWGTALYEGPRFGLECEVECVKSYHTISGFLATEDGSLRNHGVEFISDQPYPLVDCVHYFKNLHKAIKWREGDPFSSRTSTHVHMNVSDMELPQVRTLVLLYALFEEYFFQMALPSRRDNIHCVPLTDTILPTLYAKDFVFFVNKWSKYTALNLLRIKDLGTVEFRHLEGTNNSELLHKWLTVLFSLRCLSQRAEISTDTLKNPVQINDWFTEIFGHTSLKLSFETIQSSLIDVKLSTITKG